MRPKLLVYFMPLTGQEFRNAVMGQGFISLINFLDSRAFKCLGRALKSFALERWFLVVKFYMVGRQVIVTSVQLAWSYLNILRECTIVMKQTQRPPGL